MQLVLLMLTLFRRSRSSTWKSCPTSASVRNFHLHKRFVCPRPEICWLSPCQLNSAPSGLTARQTLHLSASRNGWNTGKEPNRTELRWAWVNPWPQMSCHLFACQNNLAQKWLAFKICTTAVIL